MPKRTKDINLIEEELIEEEEEVLVEEPIEQDLAPDSFIPKYKEMIDNFINNNNLTNYKIIDGSVHGGFPDKEDFLNYDCLIIYGWNMGIPGFRWVHPLVNNYLIPYGYYKVLDEKATSKGGVLILSRK